MMRTTAYAASVRAKSTRRKVSLALLQGCLSVYLTAETSSGAGTKWDVAPFLVDWVMVNRHILIPPLRAEKLGVHSEKIRSAMHSVHAEGHRTALWDQDWRLSVRPASCWQYGRPNSITSIDGYRRIES